MSPRKQIAWVVIGLAGFSIVFVAGMDAGRDYQRWADIQYIEGPEITGSLSANIQTATIAWRSMEAGRSSAKKKTLLSRNSQMP